MFRLAVVKVIGSLEVGWGEPLHRYAVQQKSWDSFTSLFKTSVTPQGRDSRDREHESVKEKRESKRRNLWLVKKNGKRSICMAKSMWTVKHCQSHPYVIFKSILAFPSVVSSIIHECLFCSVHTNQSPNPSGIHYMRASSAASNPLKLLSSVRGDHSYVTCASDVIQIVTTNQPIKWHYCGYITLCLCCGGVLWVMVEGWENVRKKTMSSIPPVHSFIHEGAQLTIWTLWLLSIVCRRGGTQMHRNAVIWVLQILESVVNSRFNLSLRARLTRVLTMLIDQCCFYVLHLLSGYAREKDSTFKLYEMKLTECVLWSNLCWNLLKQIKLFLVSVVTIISM